MALVLGTAKMIGGGVNVHFTVRMEAAELLYKSGRIKHFLVSGDNSRDGYNEPEDMKADLMARGIPAAAITCDYAGFRTLDSVVRAKENFGLTRCVIISDDFHLARALWLADRQGLAATGFYAPPVIWKNSWRPRCREWLARYRSRGGWRHRQAPEVWRGEDHPVRRRGLISLSGAFADVKSAGQRARLCYNRRFMRILPLLPAILTLSASACLAGEVTWKTINLTDEFHCRRRGLRRLQQGRQKTTSPMAPTGGKVRTSKSATRSMKGSPWIPAAIPRTSSPMLRT